jgi:predicted aspartyl protease
MIPVIYNVRYPFIRNEPRADVWLEPNHPRSPNYLCLVDTGAEYLQLPAAAASQVGLSLANAPTKNFRTAGGSVRLPYLTGLSVEIEGNLVTVDVVFDTQTRPLALLGRRALLAIYQVGFNTSEWLSD